MTGPAPGAVTTGRAFFSEDGLYRYTLRRQLRPERVGTCVFVMLNPSTADAVRDDPTIRRCIGFARRWGFSELLVANLFALRATAPSALRDAEDPVGPLNDDCLRAAAAAADLLVCAWGNHGALLGRAREALALLAGHELWALGVTRAGQPRHPLYVRGDAGPVRLSAAAAGEGAVPPRRDARASSTVSAKVRPGRPSSAGRGHS